MRARGRKVADGSREGEDGSVGGKKQEQEKSVAREWRRVEGLGAGGGGRGGRVRVSKN